MTLGRPVSNRHKVPSKQWGKWSESARRMFNYMYSRLGDQWRYLHPEAPVAPKEQWNTTRWNVAWEAADAVDGR